MIDGLKLGMVGLAGGVLGALLGGWLAWRLVGARLDAWGRSWQDAPQRVRQDLQQALRVELDFLAHAQAQRDATLARRAEEHATTLRALVDGLAVTAGPAIVRAMAAAPVAVPVPMPPRDDSEPSRELSDDELDALPPELPVPDRSRRRILPAPKKPVLQRL